MKSIKYIVAGLILAGFAASSQAVITVNWASNFNTFLTDNTGAANYLTGDLVEIGTFASAPTIGSSSLAGFSVFDSTLAVAGAISASSTFPGGATFGHNQIYLVVFNAATAGLATQEGIFFVDMASNAAWRFPADADTINTTKIDLQDMYVGTDGAGAAATGATVVFGATGQDGSGPYHLLETVPEPSSYALVGMGLLGAIGLIRRRK